MRMSSTTTTRIGRRSESGRCTRSLVIGLLAGWLSIALGAAVSAGESVELSEGQVHAAKIGRGLRSARRKLQPWRLTLSRHIRSGWTATPQLPRRRYTLYTSGSTRKPGWPPMRPCGSGSKSSYAESLRRTRKPLRTNATRSSATSLLAHWIIPDHASGGAPDPLYASLSAMHVGVISRTLILEQFNHARGLKQAQEAVEPAVLLHRLSEVRPRPFVGLNRKARSDSS
jgi:hypothetical protein